MCCSNATYDVFIREIKHLNLCVCLLRVVKCSRQHKALISTGEQHAGFHEQVKFTGNITTEIVSIINRLLLLSAASIISFSKK